MDRRHVGLIIVGVIFLAVMTVIGVIKCADNKANVLWPEGRVITR